MLDSAYCILAVFHLHLKGDEEHLLADKLGALGKQHLQVPLLRGTRSAGKAQP